MVRKLPIIREIFKEDHNAAVLVARKLKRKQISTLSGTLNDIISVTKILQLSVQFTALYSLAFFTFFHFTLKFDPSRQQGGRHFSDLGANVIINWLKTIQNKTEIHTIPIPKLMQCFNWNRQAGNYAFLESRDQCLHGWLGSVSSSRPVGESR